MIEKSPLDYNLSECDFMDRVNLLELNKKVLNSILDMQSMLPIQKQTSENGFQKYKRDLTRTPKVT